MKELAEKIKRFVQHSINFANGHVISHDSFQSCQYSNFRTVHFTFDHSL